MDDVLLADAVERCRECNSCLKDIKTLNSWGTLIESCCILGYRRVLCDTSLELREASLIKNHYREARIGLV